MSQYLPILKSWFGKFLSAALAALLAVLVSVGDFPDVAGWKGNASAIGSLVVAGVTQFGPSSGTGADALTSGSSTGHASSISGTSVTYSRATGTSTNPGDGGNSGGATVAGTVIIRYER